MVEVSNAKFMRFFSKEIFDLLFVKIQKQLLGGVL